MFHTSDDYGDDDGDYDDGDDGDADCDDENGDDADDEDANDDGDSLVLLHLVRITNTVKSRAHHSIYNFSLPFLDNEVLTSHHSTDAQNSVWRNSISIHERFYRAPLIGFLQLIFNIIIFLQEPEHRLFAFR